MRTDKSLKNLIFGLGGQIFNLLMNFINRTIFIHIMGVEYLGVNGLFSNILSVLSLAELGVGSAIIYHMYHPLSTNDNEKIKSLMYIYKTTYKYIGIFIAIIGLCSTPCLGYIIKDNPNIENLNLSLVYLLFLMNSVSSYFYIYKASLITADQKNYIVVLNQQKFIFLQSILQCVFLLTFKNYYLYLIVQILITICMNIAISRKANKLYPFILDKNIEKLSKNESKLIFRHVRAAFSHKFGGVVVNSTDNILISSFIGVLWVGIYSNYLMLINIVNSLISQFFTAITASVGNLATTDDKEKCYNVYHKILFLNFWIYGMCTICLLFLLNPFINMWLGEKYTLDFSIVLVLVINFYISGMRQSTITYNSTLGLFWHDRYKPWFEASINLVASIYILKKYGLIGVFLGTTISTIFTSLWIEPFILYKHGFNKNVLDYFKYYMKYGIILIVSIIVINPILVLVDLEHNFLSLCIKGIICVLVSNIIFCLCLFRTQEFKTIFVIIKGLIIKNKTLFKIKASEE